MVLVLQKRQGKETALLIEPIGNLLGMPSSRTKAQYFLGWDVVDVVNLHIC